jgi:hypothetical protein
MMLAISLNKRLLTVCNIFLKALNYLKAYWKHKSSETAENFSFYRLSSILVKILSKKTDLNICDSRIIHLYFIFEYECIHDSKQKSDVLTFV